MTITIKGWITVGIGILVSHEWVIWLLWCADDDDDDGYVFFFLLISFFQVFVALIVAAQGKGCAEMTWMSIVQVKGNYQHKVKLVLFVVSVYVFNHTGKFRSDSHHTHTHISFPTVPKNSLSLSLGCIFLNSLVRHLKLNHLPSVASLERTQCCKLLFCSRSYTRCV